MCVPAQRTPGGGIRLTEGGLQMLSAEAAALEVGTKGTEDCCSLRSVTKTSRASHAHQQQAAREPAHCPWPTWTQAFRVGPASAVPPPSRQRLLLQAPPTVPGAAAAAELLASCCADVPRMEAQAAAMQLGAEPAVVDQHLQAGEVLEARELVQQLQRLAYLRRLLAGAHACLESAGGQLQASMRALEPAQHALQEVITLHNTLVRARGPGWRLLSMGVLGRRGQGCMRVLGAAARRLSVANTCRPHVCMPPAAGPSGSAAAAGRLHAAAAQNGCRPCIPGCRAAPGRPPAAAVQASSRGAARLCSAQGERLLIRGRGGSAGMRLIARLPCPHA